MDTLLCVDDVRKRKKPECKFKVMDEVVKHQLARNQNKLTRHPRNVIKLVGTNQSKLRLCALHTCEPETTKKTEIFVLRCVITPPVPRGFDILVMSHILSYENTLTHIMLRFTAGVTLLRFSKTSRRSIGGAFVPTDNVINARYCNNCPIM